MPSLYERAHEIKKATGWSQERLSAETGLGLSTISRIFRVPGYNGNAISRQLMLQLHESVVQSPFPAELEKLLNRYERFKEQKSEREFAEYLDLFEPVLAKHERCFLAYSCDVSQVLRWDIKIT